MNATSGSSDSSGAERAPEMPSTGRPVSYSLPDIRHVSGMQLGDATLQINNFGALGPRDAWPHQVGAMPSVSERFHVRRACRLLAETDGSCLILRGLSGVGKTWLAAWYCETAIAENRADLVVWAPAPSRNSVESVYAQAYGEITGERVGSVSEGAQRFITWLREHRDVRWIVVLDNVRAPADVSGLWPPLKSDLGRTIVTTWRRDAALAARGRTVLEIAPFTESEATGYLQAQPVDVAEQADASGRLVHRLDLLPLAISQAVAFMVDHRLTCSEYLERLERRPRLKLARLLPENEALPDEQHSSVADTLALSIDYADHLEPAEVAGFMLEIASVLDPHGIPERLFGSPAARRYISERQAHGQTRSKPPDFSNEQASDGLSSLSRLSLLDIDNGRTGHVIRTHELVQRCAVDRMDHSQIRPLVEAAATALVEIWPEVDSERGLSGSLRANALILAAEHGGELWQPNAHPVLFRLGRSLGEAGDAPAAVAHFEQLMENARARQGPYGDDVFAARFNLAHWHGWSGKPGKAVDGLLSLVADAQRRLGPHDHRTLLYRRNLAHWRGKAGDRAGAVAAFEQLLADLAAVRGSQDDEVLLARNYLTRWRSELDGPRVADLEALLDEHLSNLGADHPNTLAVRANLAWWSGMAGDAERAVAEFATLLAADRRVFGEEHPNTLTARHDLAVWTGRAGASAEAAAELVSVLADRRRLLGPDHPHTLVSRQSVAHWRAQAGLADAAETVAALESVELEQIRILGPEHAQTMSTGELKAYWAARAAVEGDQGP